MEQALSKVSRWNAIRLTSVVLAAITCANAHAQGAPKPAVPIDPVEGIVAAFKTHKVVALGEGGTPMSRG